MTTLILNLAVCVCTCIESYITELKFSLVHCFLQNKRFDYFPVAFISVKKNITTNNIHTLKYSQISVKILLATTCQLQDKSRWYSINHMMQSLWGNHTHQATNLCPYLGEWTACVCGSLPWTTLRGGGAQIPGHKYSSNQFCGCCPMHAEPEQS